jgi:hypothetical protein
MCLNAAVKDGRNMFYELNSTHVGGNPRGKTYSYYDTDTYDEVGDVSCISNETYSITECHDKESMLKN